MLEKGADANLHTTQIYTAVSIAQPSVGKQTCVRKGTGISCDA